MQICYKAYASFVYIIFCKKIGVIVLQHGPVKLKQCDQVGRLLTFLTFYNNENSPNKICQIKFKILTIAIKSLKLFLLILSNLITLASKGPKVRATKRPTPPSRFFCLNFFFTFSSKLKRLFSRILEAKAAKFSPNFF